MADPVQLNLFGQVVPAAEALAPPPADPPEFTDADYEFEEDWDTWMRNLGPGQAA